MRLYGSWQSANRQSDNEKWTNYTLGIDHIFNLSTAFAGYNSYRMFELSTVEGLGVHLASLAGEKQKAVDFHLGLQMKISTGTRLDVFMEPGVSFYTDGIDISGNNNSHGYDIGFNARVGMNYRLGTFTRVEVRKPGMKISWIIHLSVRGWDCRRRIPHWPENKGC